MRREEKPAPVLLLIPRQDIRNLTGPITECSETHPSILSSPLLKDNGERGKTRDCWQTSGPFSSPCLFPLMEASCHAVSTHADAHMARNPCLWPRASAALVSASSHVSDPGRGSEPWDDTSLSQRSRCGLVRNPEPVVHLGHPQVWAQWTLGLIDVSSPSAVNLGAALFHSSR